MTYMTDKPQGHESASAWQRLNGLWLDVTERLAKYWLYRSTMADLAMLSDRDLSDIGISRGSIDEVAAKTAYKA
jgi:uncharacterized protein YjiS (DUF1127 family)